MNLLYLGAGFVGSCSAAVAANSGHKTLIYDIDKERVELLSSGDRDVIESCLSEPGLGDLLARNNERVKFTFDFSEVERFLSDCDAIFICVPTPEIGETGESDLKYFYDALDKVSRGLINRNAQKQDKYVLMVNKSTVPIDTAYKTKLLLEKAGVKNFGVVSNPEFLVMGKAIHDSIKPDRIVIGAWGQKDFEVMRKIYRHFFDSPTVHYIEVNPQEAAAGKLLANYYLFNKLANCFDVMGRTCEAFEELKFENLRGILSSDSRIGSWGFFDSLCVGGSCLIKDSRSLMHQLRLKNKNVALINETYLANKRQLEHFVDRAEKEAGFDWRQKKVAILGLAFKRDTNDIRDSAAVKITGLILSKNIKEITVYDPAAMKNFKRFFPPSDIIKYSANEAEAIKDADVVIIVTDWPQFREAGDLVMQLSKNPLIMDGRRMLQHKYDELQNKGYNIIAVGSPFLKGK
ncbi:MAG: nucleotide sugar dehydrogenase [Patescibacteria group bacterium]